MELPAYKKQSVQYYPSASKFNVGIEHTILTRLRYYLAELLYSHEIDQTDFTTSIKQLIKQRILPANLTNDFALRTEVKNSVHNFDQNSSDIKYFSNNNFPFTVYNLGDAPILREVSKNNSGEIGSVYFPEVGDYLTLTPIEQTFEFISFFTTAQDYDEAILRLNQAGDYIRLDFPVLLNNVEYTFYFDLGWEIAKGEYTEDFEVYLDKNKIWDIVHNATVYYTAISPKKSLTIANVTDIAVSLYNKKADETYNLLDTFLLTNVDSKISITTNFVNGQIGWNKSTSLIFNFNIPIVESGFTGNFSIDPNPTGRFISPDTGLQLTYEPYGGSFAANTLYTITIPKFKIQSETGFWVKTDLVYTFTTGA